VYANRTATIADVQSLPSPEVTLLQMCDVLLGAASIRIKMAPFVRRVLTRCLPELIEVSAQFEEMPEKYGAPDTDSQIISSFALSVRGQDFTFQGPKSPKLTE
jgi:hypothetical protein